MEIHDLFKDLADGKMLMKLLEIISGENLGKPNKGILRVQKAENLNRCLTFLRTKVPFLIVFFLETSLFNPFSHTDAL